MFHMKQELSVSVCMNRNGSVPDNPCILYNKTNHEVCRSMSTMRRSQGFLSGRLSGVGAKELLWLPIGDQERLVSDLLCLSKKVGRV